MNILPSDNLLSEMTPTAILSPSVLPGPQEQSPRTTAAARVLQLINGEHYAGAERAQDLWAQYLPQYGFEVGFVCIKPKQFAELRQSQNTPLYKLPMRNRLDLSVVGKIARIVRQEEYKLIHTHTVRTALVGSLVAKLTGVPMVHHVHSPASRDTTRRWLNYINSRVERFCLRQASRLIAVSESLKRHMILQGFDPSLISVVHPGALALYEVPFRAAPCSSWTLGTTALFRPRKGIENLLQALAILRDRGLPVRLRAIGPFESAKYESDMHALSKRLNLQDIIEWTGFTNEVMSEMLKIDLFVLPSLFGEGLPMVLLEAMAAGVPVVATDVEGVTEAVRHGQEGVIVPPGDADAFAQAVIDVIEGRYDWSAMRQSALERQAQSFSTRSMVEGVAAVYRQVLES